MRLDRKGTFLFEEDCLGMLLTHKCPRCAHIVKMEREVTVALVTNALEERI